MAEGRAEALARGDVPLSPLYAGVLATGGALGGALIGLWAAPWRELVAACFGGGEDATALARQVATWGVVGTFAGLITGLGLASVTLGAFALGLRRHLPRRGRPGGAALVVWLAVPAVLAAPWAIGAFARGDAGRALVAAPMAALGLGLLALLPFALIARARARSAWLERVEPSMPPRRDDDEMSPEARAALFDRAGAPVSPARPGAP